MAKQSKTAKLEQEHQELKELLQRNLAEFQNYQKRTEKDKAQMIKTATENIIQKILPIIDNLELALTNNKEQNDFTKGVEMIYTQLIEVLEEEGVKQIQSDEFDPNLHEVVLVDENANEESIIVLQKGYMLNEKVLRCAKVKINKNKGDRNE